MDVNRLFSPSFRSRWIIVRAFFGCLPGVGLEAQAQLEEFEKESPLAFFEEADSSATTIFGWDSLYLSEGRDELGGSGMFHTEFAGSVGPVTVGTWYGDGTEADYGEWNLFAEWGFELSETVSLSLGYTYLAFFSEGEDAKDNELGMGWVYLFGDRLELAADVVYSTEAEGAFVDLALAAPFEAAASIKLAPYAQLGLDFGYRTEEYDGPNHFQIGVSAELPVYRRFAFGGFAAYSFALQDIDREEDRTGADLGDQPAFGVFARILF